MKIKTFQQSLFVLILATLSLQCQGQKDLSSPTSTEIDAVFSNYSSLETPGAAVAVVHKGKIVFTQGYGSANLEYDIPITSKTIFHAASVSKQFTVFATLLLEEDGKLSLDDDVRKHLPEVPDFGKKITLRHLASHTSGLRDQWELLSMAGWRLDDVITDEHILRIVSKQKELNFEPGAEYLYSNTGFTLLAEVVSRVSGKTFADFTQERIFKPLAMVNSQFYDDHEKIVKNRAYSYRQTRDGNYFKSVLSYANVGATSLFTTVEDMTHWTVNFQNPKVGSKRLISKMNTLAKLNNGETFGGALGQFVNQHNGLNQIQHGGADAGYRAYVGRFPDQDFAVVVLSNHSRFNPPRAALSVADLYLSPLYESRQEAAPAQATTFLKTDTKVLKTYENDYWSKEGGFGVKVYIKNDTLIMARDGRPDKLGQVGENQFKVISARNSVVLSFSTKNNTQELSVKIGSGEPIYFKPYNPTKYPLSNATDYIGKYYSEELETTYEVVLEKDQLVTKHQRNDDMTFRPLMQDVFRMNRWFFDNLRFERDGNGKISGFRVDNSRVKNLLFTKVNQP